MKYLVLSPRHDEPSGQRPDVIQSYLVESYAAGAGVDDQRRRARQAAEVGVGVRYIRTMFLPGDETLLHVFEAASPEALSEAARVAELPYERIVEAVEGSTESQEPEAKE
jgi:Nickel responsive protein SCO4226-like